MLDGSVNLLNIVSKTSLMVTGEEDAFCIVSHLHLDVRALLASGARTVVTASAINLFGRKCIEFLQKLSHV